MDKEVIKTQIYVLETQRDFLEFLIHDLKFKLRNLEDEQ